MPTPVKLLIFDLHGVLVEPSKIAKAYFDHHTTYLQNNLGLTFKEADERYSKALKNFERFKPDLLATPLDEPLIRLMRTICYQWEFDILQNTDLVTQHGHHIAFFQREAIIEGSKNENYYFYPEAITALQKLVENKKFSFCLASSASQLHIEAVLDTSSVKHLFSEAIIGYDTISARKNTPEFFERVAANLDYDPIDCLVIGNSASEIIMPQMVGMRSLFLEREHMVPIEVQKQADFRAKTLIEAVDILVNIHWKPSME